MKKKAEEQKNAVKLTFIEKKRILTAEGEPTLSYELRCPKLEGNAGALGRIDRYYRKTEAVWEKRWKDQLYRQACKELSARRAVSRQFTPWQCQLTGEVTKNDGVLLALRMEVREIRGDGRPCLLCWGDVWDMSTGAPCTVRDLWGGGKSWKRDIIAQVLEQGSQRQKTGDCFLDAGWEKEVSRLLRGAEPGLTKDGLEFYLPQCAVTPPAEGIPTFTVRRRLEE